MSNKFLDIRTVDLRGSRLSKSAYQAKLPRAQLDIATAMRAIEPILEQVKNGTEADLIALGEKFDGVMPPQIRVPESVITESLSTLDPKVRTALEEAIRRVTKVHADQARGVTRTEVVTGASVEQRWIPVDRVGLYVPGGRAVYPLSLIHI